MSDVEVGIMVGFMTIVSQSGAYATNILEIGCFQGRSTSAFATLANTKVWCVDNFRGPTDEPEYSGLRATFEANIQKTGAHRRVIVKEGDSVEVMKTLPPEFFDLILIDADHSQEAVQADTRAAWPLLKEGGYMFFDDINRPSVTAGLRDAFVDLGFGPQLSIYTATHKLGFVRKVGGAPKTCLDYLPAHFKDVKTIK